MHLLKTKKVDRSRIVTSSTPTIPKDRIIDIHKQIKAKVLDKDDLRKGKKFQVKANFGDSKPAITPLDITTWLPFAAKHYQISPNIEDYIFIPVFIMPTDLANRNGVGFPLKTLAEFRPDYGMQAYKTFKGKPTFYNHANTDITKAHGVVVDAYMRQLTGFKGNVMKLNTLLAFDRTKYVETVDKIATGELNTYSMGAYVDEYSCSYCAAKLGNCTHIKKNRVDFYEKDGKLVYKNVHGATGFEVSSVPVPAYAPAISNQILM